MKKIKNVSFLIILAVTVIMLVTACSFFSPDGSNVNKYAVTLDLNGGAGVSAADFVDHGKLKQPDSIPVKSGFDFDGWYFDKDFTEKATFGEALTEDIAVYAKWTARLYKATVVLGGNDNREITVNEENKFVIPSEYEVKTGYDFDGWFTDAALKTPADFTVVAIEDKVFYGKWTAVKYEIKYVTDGVAKEPLDAKRYYTVEDKIVLSSPSAIKSGYDFLGWFDEDGGKVISIEKGSTGDIVLTAKFICRNNYIEYVKGGSVDGNVARANLPNSASKIDIASLIGVSDKATFVVKDGDGNPIKAGVETNLGVGDNIFSVAVKAEDGTEREYTINVHRYDAGTVVVTFAYSGLFPDSTVSVSKGATVQNPEPKDATGYDFKGWFIDEEYNTEYDFNSAVVTEITICAKYEAINYNIVYNAGIWTVSSEAPSTFIVTDTVVLLPPVSKNENVEDERYVFDGWYTSGNSFVAEISAGTCEDAELFARYSLKDDKKISYLEENVYSPEAEIYASEFIDYLNYCSYARRTSTDFTLLVSLNEDYDNYVQDKIREFINGNVSAALLGVVEGSSFSKDANTKTVNGVVYDKYNVTINLDFVYPTEAISSENVYSQLKYGMHGFVSTRSEDYDSFAINYISDSVSVSDTDKLFFAVTNGYRPEPVAGSAAERIYNKAKSALRKIVDDDMTDVEKAHAIYDYLILNVAYDYDLLDYVQSNSGLTKRDTQKYNGFALEGVFDDGRAVCDGISKAYALMCNIEGIECLQVTGNTTEGVGHAWNKFKVDGEWYNADPTGGGLLLSVDDDKAEGITHRYFMLTDEEMRKSNIPDTGKIGLADKVADTEYNFFATQTFTYGGTEYDYVLESAAEWKIAARYVKTMVSEYEVGLIAEFKTTAATENEAKAAVKTAFSGIYNGTYVVYFDVNTQVVIIWVM